jgi:hypothetical protein
MNEIHNKIITVIKNKAKYFVNSIPRIIGSVLALHNLSPSISSISLINSLDIVIRKENSEKLIIINGADNSVIVL